MQQAEIGKNCTTDCAVFGLPAIISLLAGKDGTLYMLLFNRIAHGIIHQRDLRVL